MTDIIVIHRASEAGRVLANALRHDGTYKVSLLVDGGLKVKVNEQMWSLPLDTDDE